ncbi:MAG: hypothetical protein RL235_788 [Chlamydiota bacterium]|jgi:hypothetical protein
MGIHRFPDHTQAFQQLQTAEEALLQAETLEALSVLEENLAPYVQVGGEVASIATRLLTQAYTKRGQVAGRMVERLKEGSLTDVVERVASLAGDLTSDEMDAVLTDVLHTIQMHPSDATTQKVMAVWERLYFANDVAPIALDLSFYAAEINKIAQAALNHDVAPFCALPEQTRFEVMRLARAEV